MSEQKHLGPLPESGYWLLWLLFAATLVPGWLWDSNYFGWGAWHWSGIDGWFQVAAVLLGCAGAVQLAASRGTRTYRRSDGFPLLWLLLAATWLIFWYADLRSSQFAWSLLVLPGTGVVFLALIAGYRRLHIAPSAAAAVFAAGAAVGLGIVWSVMVARSTCLCEGMSLSYQMTQMVTMFALYLFGPHILWRNIQCALSKH